MSRNYKGLLNSMPAEALSQNPFAVLSLVAAPALLTNASAVLVLSTVNRILRTSDRMRALSAELEKKEIPTERRNFLIAQVSRVERQSVLLLRGLHSIYVALGCFSTASLIAMMGGGLAQSPWKTLSQVMVVIGVIVGVTGVSGLVWGSRHLLMATKISIQNIKEEAALIKKREGIKGMPPD